MIRHLQSTLIPHKFWQKSSVHYIIHEPETKVHCLLDPQLSCRPVHVTLITQSINVSSWIRTFFNTSHSANITTGRYKEHTPSTEDVTDITQPGASIMHMSHNDSLDTFLATNSNVETYLWRIWYSSSSLPGLTIVVIISLITLFTSRE